MAERQDQQQRGERREVEHERAGQELLVVDRAATQATRPAAVEPAGA
jgi:hypothetical protein